MGYLYCVGHCVACKALVHFNPDLVPSLRVNGSREPLCESCAKRWGEIHSQPVRIHPDAYEPQEVA